MRPASERQRLGLWQGWICEHTRPAVWRLFQTWLRRRCGLSVSGEPWKTCEGPYLFAANHTSELDFWAIFAGLPQLLREETYVPAARDYFYRGGRSLLTALGSYHNFPFRRGAPTPQEFERLQAILEAGYSLLIFPESTRSRNGEIQEFKPMASLLALESRAALIPVAVRGTWEAWPPSQAWPRRHPIQVAFGEPLRVALAAGPRARQARELTEVLQSRVEELWENLRPRAWEGRCARF